MAGSVVDGRTASADWPPLNSRPSWPTRPFRPR